MLVFVEDVTARKKAEDYLKYLGTHDVFTGLYNRAFFVKEVARLGRGRHYPVSIIIADLDGPRQVNDNRGHAEGDKLIRRVAQVLGASLRAEAASARVGRDEFAVLLPSTNAVGAQQAITRIQNLIEISNKFYGTPLLSLSVGAATGGAGANLTEVERRTDDRMHVEKRLHHGRQRVVWECGVNGWLDAFRRWS